MGLNKANVWRKCEECKKDSRKSWVCRGRFLCANCYKKFVTILGPVIYDSPLTKNRYFGISLTEKQHGMMMKRIDFLFCGKRKVSAYIRELILSDIERGANDKQNKPILQGSKP